MLSHTRCVFTLLCGIAKMWCGTARRSVWPGLKPVRFFFFFFLNPHNYPSLVNAHHEGGRRNPEKRPSWIGKPWSCVDKGAYQRWGRAYIRAPVKFGSLYSVCDNNSNDNNGWVTSLGSATTTSAHSLSKKAQRNPSRDTGDPPPGPGSFPGGPPRQRRHVHDSKGRSNNYNCVKTGKRFSNRQNLFEPSICNHKQNEWSCGEHPLQLMRPQVNQTP